MAAGKPQVSKKTIAAKCSDVFLRDTPMFLRYKTGPLDRLAAVSCLGTSTGGMVTVLFGHGAEAGKPPEPGMEVQCQLLSMGVLYLAKGVVSDVATGPHPKVRVMVGEACLGVLLRAQQRYAIRGRLEILEPGGAVHYGYNNYQKMNLSLGGFGGKLPASALPGGEYMGFRLEALVEKGSEPSYDYPALNLEGQVCLRHTSETNDENRIYCGFSFEKLSDVLRGTLEFWLASNNEALKAL